MYPHTPIKLDEKANLKQTGFDKVKQRRFTEVTAHNTVKQYDAKAKAAGRPTLLERAKEYADGRPASEINKEAREEVGELMRAHLELVEEAVARAMSKLGNDYKE